MAVNPPMIKLPSGTYLDLREVVMFRRMYTEDGRSVAIVRHIDMPLYLDPRDSTALAVAMDQWYDRTEEKKRGND